MILITWTLESILVNLLIYLIFLIIMTIFLKIAIGLFSKAKNTSFGQVFLTSFLITLVIAFFDWILPGLFGLIISLILVWLIISERHKTGFGSAILITIIAFILYIIVLILLGLLLGITLFLLPF